MMVWNMQAERYVEFQKWMQWCPWYWLTTQQRNDVKEQDK